MSSTELPLRTLLAPLCTSLTLSRNGDLTCLSSSSEKLPYFHATIHQLRVQRHWHYHAFCCSKRSLPPCTKSLEVNVLAQLHPFHRQALKIKATYTAYANHDRFWGRRSDFLLLPGAHGHFCVPDLMHPFLRVTELP